MPLPICLYKFDKASKINEKSESNDITSPSQDMANNIRHPPFYDAKNHYKDNLSPITKEYSSLQPPKLTDSCREHSDGEDENKKSRATAQSPDKIKSILYELDQFLLEKGHT